MSMKKIMNLVLAATLICGTTTFTSCTNDDNPVKPEDNLAEKILGKWIKADRNGKPLPSDEKMVYTFKSATKCDVSASFDAGPEVGAKWIDKYEVDVTINKNLVTLTSNSEEGSTLVIEFEITAINDQEFTANHRVTITFGGAVVYVVEDVLRFTKVNRNYKEAILGLWECKGLYGGETYNDANGRLELFEDGTYNYFRKNEAGEWESMTTREFQEYFVDGTLLCTRWKNVDEDELREWWEIVTIKGDKMQWKALRQNEDGSTFEQIMDWERVVE
jgi:hypothetical protein